MNEYNGYGQEEITMSYDWGYVVEVDKREIQRATETLTKKSSDELDNAINKANEKRELIEALQNELEYQIKSVQNVFCGHEGVKFTTSGMKSYPDRTGHFSTVSGTCKKCGKFLHTEFENCISIDVESTGLDFEKNSIISIGASPIVNHSEFYVENYLRPNVEFNTKSLEINGHAELELRQRSDWGYSSELEALDKLLDFADSNCCKLICGFNPRHDYGMLLSIWTRNGRDERDFPLSYRLIDLGSLSIPILIKQGISIPPDGVSSSWLQTQLGIDPEPTPHNALTGALYNKKYIEEILKLL